MFLTRRFYISATVIILLICRWIFLQLVDSRWVVGASRVRNRRVDRYRHAVHEARHNGRTSLQRQIFQWRRQWCGDIPESRYPMTVRPNVIDEIPVIFQRRDVNFRRRWGQVETSLSDINCARAARCVWLRQNQRLRLHFHRHCATPIHLWRRQRRESVSVVSDVAPVWIASYQQPTHRLGNQTHSQGGAQHGIRANQGIRERWRLSHNQLEGEVPQASVDGECISGWAVADIQRDRQRPRDAAGIPWNDLVGLCHQRLAGAVVCRHAQRGQGGIVTLNEKFDTFVPASKQMGHIQKILDSLYAQETTFGETDFSALVANLNMHVNKRSLLVIYTSGPAA